MFRECHEPSGSLLSAPRSNPVAMPLSTLPSLINFVSNAVGIILRHGTSRARGRGFVAACLEGVGAVVWGAGHVVGKEAWASDGAVTGGGNCKTKALDNGPWDGRRRGTSVDPHDKLVKVFLPRVEHGTISALPGRGRAGGVLLGIRVRTIVEDGREEGVCFHRCFGGNPRDIVGTSRFLPSEA